MSKLRSLCPTQTAFYSLTLLLDSGFLTHLHLIAAQIIRSKIPLTLAASISDSARFDDADINGVIEQVVKDALKHWSGTVYDEQPKHHSHEIEFADMILFSAE
jgi:hypothetical protein